MSMHLEKPALNFVFENTQSCSSHGISDTKLLVIKDRNGIVTPLVVFWHDALSLEEISKTKDFHESCAINALYTWNSCW